MKAFKEGTIGAAELQGTLLKKTFVEEELDSIAVAP